MFTNNHDDGLDVCLATFFKKNVFLYYELESNISVVTSIGKSWNCWKLHGF